MKSRSTSRWLAAVLLTVATVHGAGTNPVLVSTVSASRQFTALATNTMISAALCAYAERTKREWLQQLDWRDAWRDPVLLVVRAREGDRTNAPILIAEMFQADPPRLKYQLTFVVPPMPDDATVTAALIELLCAEAANRDQPRSRGAPYLGAPIPVWLSEGLAQSALGRPDQLLAIVRRSASGRRPQTAMDLMSVVQVPGDPGDRALYRANAWLLTTGILRLPSGSRKMQQLLSELGATKTFARAFDNVYREDFPDTATLEYWWSNQLTRVRETIVAENYSLTDTARRLDAILTVETEPHPPVDQLWRHYDQPWLIHWLQDRVPALGALGVYGHPLYRPVVAEYMEAMQQLLDRRINRYRRGVAQATRLRAALDRQTRQIRETLDRVESRSGSGGTNEFADFFRTLDRLEKFEKQRHDPIGDYLDQFDH